MASPNIPAQSRLSEEQLLLEVQRRAVRFFWEKADPGTGLINDRANNFGDENSVVASGAATGYGLAALPIGVENGWLNRIEASNRARRTLRFLLNMPNVRGWILHYVDKRNGERVWESEYSSIDTALLIAGAIVCGQYFARDAATLDISVLSEALYRRIDWQWMLTNNYTQPNKKVLSHGWKPETGFITYNYDSYSEAILLYLLGLGAPVNPLPGTTWESIARPLQTYYGIESLKAGPIFIHQMPSGFFCFGNQRDKLGFDYWASSRNAMKIHRQFCIDRSGDAQTYARDVIGIDLGMALLAIENYRSGTVWRLMNSFYPILPAFRAAGFRSTSEPEPRPVHTH